MGADFETGFSLTSSGLTATQIAEGKQSFHIWESPAGDTTVSLGVVRIVNKLWFMNMLAPSPSAALKNGGSPITIGGLANNDIEVSVINNSCIIVSKDLDNPVLLTYDKSSGNVSQSTISLKIRDIYGVDDGLFIDTRPTTLSATHKYNLRNQGWNKNIVTADASYPDALDYHEHETGQYPSNADSWTLGKVSNVSSADYEKYDPDTLVKNSQSNFQIAKGSFIIDAFSRGASRMSKSDVTSGLPSDAEQGNVSTVTSYAQRVFYSGIESNVSGGDSRSPNYSGYVFFSKVIRSNEDLGVCHQEADPTDPGINDLIDTDGGSIQIPDITKIVKIVASQASILVFAENGVWEIYGDTGGFIATSFQASKISTNGVFNPNAVVNVEHTSVLWQSMINKKQQTKELDKLFAPGEDLHILIMNVEAFSTKKGVEFAAKFLRCHRTMMAIDESTTIKKSRCKRTKHICTLGEYAGYKRILTGSPVTKSPLDLYKQCEFLKKRIIRSHLIIHLELDMLL